MAKIYFLFSFFACVGVTFSQTDTVVYRQLQDLKNKKISYHKLTNGEYDGYRIKIHFGQSREEATEIKSKFLSKYNYVSAYDEYQQPNFVVLVGDFKNKPEAYGFLTEIKADFPAAFIVKDKIRPLQLREK